MLRINRHELSILTTFAWGGFIANNIPIRIILLDDRKLEKENKIRLGIITMDLTEIKKKYTSDILNYIYETSREYIKNIRKTLSQIV